MHSNAKPATYDVAEVAAEVVREMFEYGYTVAIATSDVLIQRGLHFDRALEIQNKAQELFSCQSQIKASLEASRGRKIRFRHYTHASATAAALG